MVEERIADLSPVNGPRIQRFWRRGFGRFDSNANLKKLDRKKMILIKNIVHNQFIKFMKRNFIQSYDLFLQLNDDHQ